MRTMVGLRRYQYIFDLDSRSKMVRYMNRLADFGTVVELFINNAYGFEFRLSRVVV